MTRMTALLKRVVLCGVGGGMLTVAASAQATVATSYKATADRLIAASLADPEGYSNLAYLCDHVGKRVSGSEPLARAIAWSAELMKKEGLVNVRTQAATVPHWVRGNEAGEIIAPVTKRLHMLGLGMSVATPPAGITAEVVVVPDFAALEKLGKRRRGGQDRGLQRAIQGLWADRDVSHGRAQPGGGAGRGGGAGAVNYAAGDADAAHRHDGV